METSTGNGVVDRSFVSKLPNHSGLSAVIHPLALLNITDHFTRVKAQSSSPSDQYKVMGILLGTQSGRKVTINNSFEVKVNLKYPDELTSQPLVVEIDEGYLDTKQEHLKQVFPNLDVIGWYSVGAEPTFLECELQQKYIQPRIDSPLYLQFVTQSLLGKDTTFHPSLHNRTDLPLVIYEPFYDVNSTSFIEIPDYSVETDFTQRIALAAMIQAKGTHESQTLNDQSEAANQAELDSPSLSQLARQRSTVIILSSRISTLMDYIEAIEKGEISPDHSILREIASLLNQLPHLQNDISLNPPTTNILYQSGSWVYPVWGIRNCHFFETFFWVKRIVSPNYTILSHSEPHLEKTLEYNDVLLGNFLASVTRGVSQLADIAGSLQSSYEYARRNILAEPAHSMSRSKFRYPN